MNKSATIFCEICQIKVEEDVKLNRLNSDCKSKVLEFLPEIELHLTDNSVICDQCFTQITDAQELKQLQIKEEMLQQNLPSNNNFKEPDANLNEVLVNDNTIRVKEEPGIEKIKEEFNASLVKDEVCDSQVINDGFLVNTDNKKYYCHDCGWCTDTKRNLIKHIYKQHRKEGVGKKDILRKPTIKKIYQCDKCEYKTKFSSSWRYHKLTHNEKLFKCTQCNYANIWSRGLKFKKYKRTGKYPFQCDKCDSKFKPISSFKTHIKSQHTNEKPYQCDMCVYKTVRIEYLKAHILSQHTDELPYQCDKCSYKCVYKSHLNRHILSKHTGLKPYQCDKCDYKCSYVSSLKRHTLSQHTDLKPYQCDHCDYRCGDKSHLKRHTSQHTHLKPYQCDKCDYKSARRDGLKSHILYQHTGEKLYQCDRCDFNGGNKTNLKKHTLSQHAGF